MNRNIEKLVIPVCLFGVFVLWISGSAGSSVPNLTEQCFRCLCYVSTKCDMSHGCTGGHCGPFNISRIYWIEAGRVVTPEDEGHHGYNWMECAKNYQCAKKTVEGYLERFGKDCNGDGVTDCFDYMMVNANGGYGCTAPLNRSVNGRRWLQRFSECQL